MRFHCTVLVAIAVAIVSTNALDDTDGKERMFSPFRYEKLPKAGPSNPATSSSNPATDKFMEHTENMKQLMNGHDTKSFFKSANYELMLKEFADYSRELPQSGSIPFVMQYLRKKWTDNAIIQGLIGNPTKYSKVKDDLFSEFMRSGTKKTYTENEFRYLALSKHKKWGDDYRAAIIEAIKRTEDSEEIKRLGKLLS